MERVRFKRYILTDFSNSCNLQGLATKYRNEILVNQSPMKWVIMDKLFSGKILNVTSQLACSKLTAQS